jgi:4-amino-4-deoxy-L-arabinose transferase-like glycosyltransferase
MDETMSWWRSRTVWAGLVAVLASLLAGLRVTISPDTQAGLVDVLANLAAAVAGAVAVWGRIRAERRIGRGGDGTGGDQGGGPAVQLLLVAMLAMLLAGAGGCVSATWRAAERATYDAVAGEYAGYVASDQTLDDEQRARRLRTIETWRRRVEERGTEGAKE